jgi:hypothetical protein
MSTPENATTDRPTPDIDRRPTTQAAEDFESMGQSKRREYLRELTSTGSNMAGVEFVENLLSQDLVLGNISSADRTEIKHLARMWQHLIEPAVPPKGSLITGQYRAALLDDPNDDYRPMTQGEKLSLEQTLMTLINVRASRSEQGFQQDKISEQRQVQRLEDEREDRPGESESKSVGERIGGIFR